MSSAPATEFVTYALDGHIATITFNRPDRLNALLPDMIHTYSNLLDFADADPHVRVIIVTGAGRGFCSGADLSILGEDPELVQGFLHGQSHATVPGKFLHMSTPVITAINGPAAGLGFVIAISADFRFTKSDAKLSSTFSRLGLIAEYGIAWLLPRLVGLARATELLISGRSFSGQDAYEYGLVLAASDDPLADAYACANDLIAHCSPASIAVIKAQLLRGMNADFNDSADDAFIEMGYAFEREDLATALAGKINKVPPQFPAL